jgi:hypothetical protein
VRRAIDLDQSMAVAVQFAIGGITMVARPNDALIVQLCGIEALPVTGLLAGDQCVARRMWKGGRHARLRTAPVGGEVTSFSRFS